VAEWGKAPWTLWAYVGISLATTFVVTIVVSSTPVAPRLFFVVFEVVVCFFLLRRVRWLWLLTIAFILLDFLLGTIEDKLKWYGIAQGMVALVLLLHPATREFFRRTETPASA
jgi:hypothetical protein